MQAYSRICSSLYFLESIPNVLVIGTADKLYLSLLVLLLLLANVAFPLVLHCHLALPDLTDLISPFPWALDFVLALPSASALEVGDHRTRN